MKNLLYNLTDQQTDIYRMIDDADGEITPEIEKELGKFETNEVGRVMTMKTLANMLQDKAELAKKKKDEYRKLEQTFKNGFDRIKIWMVDYLQKSGKKRVEYEAESVALRKTPNKVVVDDENEIPGKYKTFTVKMNYQQYSALKTECEFNDWELAEPKIDIDKTAIMADYKNGVEIAGTHVESGFTVTLKG